MLLKQHSEGSQEDTVFMLRKPNIYWHNFWKLFMYSKHNEAASVRDAMLHAFATVAQGGTVLHEHRIHLL